MEEKKIFTENKISLVNRKMLTITGVQKVVSVKETELVLEVSGSGLIVVGSNLEVSKLDVVSGVVEVTGLVDSMRFTVSSNKQPILKRIFK